MVGRKQISTGRKSTFFWFVVEEKYSHAPYKRTVKVEILAGKIFTENEHDSREKPQCVDRVKFSRNISPAK